MRANNLSTGAVMATVILALLFGASSLPTGRFTLLALTTVASALTIMRCNVRTALIQYVAAAVLAFFLLPNKFIALVFALFFGNYAILKLYIERLRNLVVEWVVKILLFNLYLAVGYGLWKAFFPVLPVGFSVWIAAAVANLAFIIFDLALTYLFPWLGARLGRR